MLKFIKLSFVAVVILLITILSLSIYNHSNIYPYDVDEDYEYKFDSNYDITSLNLKDRKFFFVNNDTMNQSAFLRLQVHSTFLGKYFQPSVDVNSGKLKITQFFEHGADGIRYINVSSLSHKDTLEIELIEKNIEIPNQSVQLIRCKNQNIEAAKILVLAPHPDDAEIAAYGLYTENKESYIVTVTAGEAGDYHYDEIYEDEVLHYLKKGQLRVWNSLTVPMLGGIPPEHTVNLGFFDGTLKKMHQNKLKPVKGLHTNISDINTFRKYNVSTLSKNLVGNSSWNSLVDNLIYLLKEIKPNIIVAPYPALDSHSDHKLSSVALFEAIKALDIQEGSLYLYTNHFVLNEHYPYGEEGGAISLPPNFNNTFYFDGLYSHHLTAKKQKDKIFALEAMHDLRPDTEWRHFKHNVFKVPYKQISSTIKGGDNSYFKRSVRSNELFFVLKMTSLYDDVKMKKIIGDLE